MRKLMAGMDLHSNNVMIGIVDRQGARLAHRKVDCNLAQVDGFLKPYKERLEKVAVESTYNWYWLVDGLSELGYPMVLANPAKIEPYSGLKHGDDKGDAFHLADLLRLGILPEAYIYDKDLRPVRDLLRRRMGLVQQRTALMLSFKSLYTRTTGQAMAMSQLKSMEVKKVKELYQHPANQLIAQIQKQHIEGLTQSIEKLEKVILKSARELPYYQKLKTLPGVGVILGQTITLEVGDINRFGSPGQFASYCRTVDARRAEQRKEEGREQPEMREQVSGVGVCGSSQLRPP
jgi:transposase